MGLDQYLKTKTKNLGSKPCRGACGGMFPIAPPDNGTTEIGYWRKAYSVSNFLRELLGIRGDFNLIDKEINYEQVCYIINYAKAAIEEAKCSDEKMEITTVEAFTNAKKIFEEDPEAKIFYMEWY